VIVGKASISVKKRHAEHRHLVRLSAQRDPASAYFNRDEMSGLCLLADRMSALRILTNGFGLAWIAAIFRATPAPLKGQSQSTGFKCKDDKSKFVYLVL
jgi:hypothetical protein